MASTKPQLSQDHPQVVSASPLYQFSIAVDRGDRTLAALLAPGAQLLQAIPPVRLVDAQLKASALEQHMQAPIAPTHAHLGQLTQALPQRQLGILPARQILRATHLLDQPTGPRQFQLWAMM